MWILGLVGSLWISSVHKPTKIYFEKFLCDDKACNFNKEKFQAHNLISSFNTQHCEIQCM